MDYKTTIMCTVLLDEDFCKARRLEEKSICWKVVGLQNSKYYLYIYKYDLVPGPLPWLQLYNSKYDLKGIQCGVSSSWREMLYMVYISS